MKWFRVLARKTIAGSRSLFALALLLLFPVVASAAQDRTYPAPERNVAPTERPHVLDLLASPLENSRQGLDEGFEPLRPARFLIKPEAYWASGRAYCSLAPEPVEYGFQAREKDAESGLQYFRARSYDSMTGRFTSRDPVPHANLYMFPDNNPVNMTDPSGMISPKEAAGLERMADLYSGWGQAGIAELYRGLLWHEQQKDLLYTALLEANKANGILSMFMGPTTASISASRDYDDEWNTVKYFNEKILQAKKTFIKERLKQGRQGHYFTERKRERDWEYTYLIDLGAAIDNSDDEQFRQKTAVLEVLWMTSDENGLDIFFEARKENNALSICEMFALVMNSAATLRVAASAIDKDLLELAPKVPGVGNLSEALRSVDPIKYRPTPGARNAIMGGESLEDLTMSERILAARHYEARAAQLVEEGGTMRAQQAEYNLARARFLRVGGERPGGYLEWCKNQGLGKGTLQK